MKEKIGKIAGEIWETLREKGDINLAQLPKILKEKDVIVYQALGWLAREDKIEYHIKGNKTIVSLAESERSS
jgi:hypothetical protein